MPALAYHFGIKPWEVADLTYGEVEEFLRALRQINAANKRGGARG